MATVSVPLAGLVDTAILGHLEDIRFLAGVALARSFLTTSIGHSVFCAWERLEQLLRLWVEAI